jgi:hypothetical protein
MRNLLTLGFAAALLAVAPSSAPASHSEALLICGSLSGYSQSARPSSCFLDWPERPLAEAVGRGRAVTRTKTYDPWTHVRVRAAGRRHCATINGTRVYVYTSVRVDFGHDNVHTWRTPGCSRVGGDD